MRLVALRLGCLLATSSVLSCQNQPVPPTAASRLVGTWEMVEDQGLGSQGEIVASDRNVVGLLVYTADGRVAVQIMYRQRPEVSTASDVPSSGVGLGQIRWSADAARRAIDTYDAYFGTYEVDSQRSMVTHVVLGELRPPGVGARYLRHFEFRGDELWLTPGDPAERWRVIWRRVP